ncbi:MAG: MFS transporter [Gammaproteobacteria bacterium]|nr:MFS transporter [Gammaproteobacteria bacterium]
MNYFSNFALLRRNRNFRLLYTGQIISFIGTLITSVALPYQTFYLTHSTLMIGLLSLLQLLPLVVTALLGGVIADKHNRRTLLIITELGLMLGCILLAFNSCLPRPSLWIIFSVAPLMSAITGLHRPALDSIAQQIVDKKDFGALSSLATLKRSLCMIAGPALGGIIISVWGITATYLIDCLSFSLSLMTLLSMRAISNPSSPADRSTWISLKEGVQYALSRQELVGTYLVDFVAMIACMPNALFPAIAQSFGGAKTLGMLYSAPAVGALVVSLYSHWTTRFTRHGMAVAYSAALWGLCILFFGLAHHLSTALLFLGLAGACDALSGIFRGVIWNETIPNSLRGRLAGMEMVCYLSGPRLGDTKAGLLAAGFGITASLVSGGLLCIAGVGICCYFLPHFWRYTAARQQISTTQNDDGSVEACENT